MKSSISKLDQKLVNSFNKYLNADLNWKMWTVAPRWGVVRGKEGEIWERNGEEKDAGTQGWICRCLHSLFFHSSFLARNLETDDSTHSTNTWITPWRELTTGDVTTGPIRRKCKNISVICFYHFLYLSPEREIRKVGKDLRKENTIFEKNIGKS